MPNTRKGYMLIEMIALLSITIVIMTLTIRPLNQVMREIPRNYRDANTFTSISDALNSLKKDIQSAQSIFEQHRSEIAPAMLMLDLDSTVVTYEFNTDSISRTQSDDKTDTTSTWKLPKSEIHWTVLKDNNKAIAVELTASIKKKFAKTEMQILKNSHIFFVGRDR